MLEDVNQTTSYDYLAEKEYAPNLVFSALPYGTPDFEAHIIKFM